VKLKSQWNITDDFNILNEISRKTRADNNFELDADGKGMCLSE